MKHDASTRHVLIQQFYPYERADPDQTVTHRISSNIGLFLKSLLNHLENIAPAANFGSELAPLLYLGRELQKQMPSIIREASSVCFAPGHSSTSPAETSKERLTNDISLTEPQIMMAISEVLSESSSDLSPLSLFLSNSMPVRDGEFFFYPAMNPSKSSFVSLC